MFKKCLIVAVAVAIASASTVNAADSKAYRIANTSAAAAKTLDLTFSGTAGSLRVTVYGQDNPCPDATVNVNQGLGTASIGYPSDCVRINGLVLLKAETNNGPLAVTSLTWTDAANTVSGNLAGAEVLITVPTVSQWGLIVMTIALLIAATIIFARRKSVVTA